MILDNIHNIYMLGIGGIGMSALARYFILKGKKVAGYDRLSTLLTDTLVKEGIDIHFSAHERFIPEAYRNKNDTLIIYTPAIPDTHKELKYFKENSFNIMKRSEALGMISRDYRVIAVSGTHGKTTVSTLIAHILQISNISCTAFLGGISLNYGSNFLPTENSDLMVIEADEYDRSFLQLEPYIGIVTAIDPDHLDIYGNIHELENAFIRFTGQVKRDGKLIYNAEIKNVGLSDKTDVFHYSIDTATDFYATNIEITNGKYSFDFVSNEIELKNLKLKISGRFNIKNAVAAIAAALLCGAKPEEIRKGVETFAGTQRRFEYIIKSPDLIYIDDYAHHPEELNACIKAVREVYPDKKITGIFQPHLYTRTRDLSDEFANSLELLDELILMEIYPAREKTIKGVDSKLIFDKVRLKNKLICSKNNLIKVLNDKKIEVLLTLGAGDIDQLIEPIKKFLISAYINSILL
ncbi:MAG: UDP-N-acetylmuramate--L-alanine ligase [Bacteroidia bacterium]|nr:UDP-N-acetylmuramate--L-alanine ligase [Bacteroidia bacterium]